MTPSPEILVHVSAPSGASDDARYRQEALGYVHFEAGIRHAVLVHENQAPAISGPSPLTVQDGGGSFSDVQWSQTSSAPSTQSSSRTSKVEQKRTVPGRALGTITGPWRTPEASRAGFPHLPISSTAAPKSWGKLSSKSPYVLVEHTPANLRPRSAPTDPCYVQETPHSRRAQSDSWETPPGVVPDSQPSLPLLKRPLPSSSPSPTHQSNSRSPKRQRRRSSSPSVETSSQICRSSPAPASPSLQLQSTRTSSSVGLVAERHRSPLPESDPLPLITVLAIYAPPPKPSTEPFETYVTPYLKILVDHLPLITFFSPQQLHPPIRALEVHERGHWAFPIPSFPVGEWQKFWSYLETFIRMGNGSFGVSCVVEGRRSEGGGSSREVGRGKREELEKAEVAERRQGRKVEVGRSEEAISDPENKKQVPDEEAWMQNVENPLLKIYCWGEIVPHIWLLLFTASHRRIKGCGAQWIDSRGEVIIQMK
ncbi:hypothetical protein MMC22_002998 [Lobaria immixta]|nr:hypothetical protein [Lobaria immixta]